MTMSKVYLVRRRSEISSKRHNGFFME